MTVYYLPSSQHYIEQSCPVSCTLTFIEKNALGKFYKVILGTKYNLASKTMNNNNTIAISCRVSQQKRMQGFYGPAI